MEDSEEQKKIKKFVDSVGRDFQNFMKNKEYQRILGKKLELNCRDAKRFFKLLAKDPENGLDNSDVETFYYIVRSGRPFCGGNCGRFITRTFFTCLESLEEDHTKRFYLCWKCFKKGNFEKKDKFENKDPLILDNYALLHALGVGKVINSNLDMDGRVKLSLLAFSLCNGIQCIN